MPDGTPPSLFDLSGKVAIVTEADSAVGRSIAQQLAAHGAAVCVSAESDDASRKVAENIQADWASGSGNAFAIPSQLTGQAECEALIANVVAQAGKVDILVCQAASGSAAGGIGAGIERMQWLTRKACENMASRKDGAVVVIGSVDALKGAPDAGGLSVASAAGMQIVRNIAAEWGPSNIRANGVAIAEISDSPAASADEDAQKQQLVEWTYPMQRTGNAEEVAGCVVAMVSAAAAWTTGQTIVIDGGMMAGSGRVEG